MSRARLLKNTKAVMKEIKEDLKGLEKWNDVHGHALFKFPIINMSIPHSNDL